MPLTSAQYDALGPTRLLQRLLEQHLHLLALRVSAFLPSHSAGAAGLATIQAAVTRHWGCAKIQAAAVRSRDAYMHACGQVT